MARSLNKIMVIGNVGRDAQMRYLPSGKPVTNFSVAVSRSWRTPEGESREETQWFNVEAWDRLAEICNEYVKKGGKVYVEGRLRTREYDDRNGQKRLAVEISASDIMLLDGRPTDGAPAGVAVRESAGPAGADDGDDLGEMPF